MWCRQLNNNLAFYPHKMEICCSGFQGPVLLEEFSDGEEINWEEIIAKKRELIKRFAQGDILEKCKGCYELRDGTPPPHENAKFKKLILNHYTHCNCKCVYCARLKYYTRDFTEKPQAPEKYHLLPILKQIYNLGENVCQNSMILDFQGGDLGVLDEFEDIIKFLLENNFWDLFFTTNNIVYQPLIAQCLAIGKGKIITSVDSGCRETYQKVKKVDKFDAVIENLKKYLEIPNAAEEILVSYIVVRNINDNVEEVEKFLNLMKEIGIKRVRFEIDYNEFWGDKGKHFKVPEHYYEIFNLFNDFTAKNDMTFLYQDFTKEILDKGGYDS